MPFLFFTLFLLAGCEPKPIDSSGHKIDDLVLVEFAARLEEDYHRLHPVKEESGKKISEKSIVNDPTMPQENSEEPHLNDSNP